ncbi:MAG: hypothetical protein PHT07_08330 [Paludibacter sp.]|nr:hypothetical protein [Paludibacter sp.]
MKSVLYSIILILIMLSLTTCYYYKEDIRYSKNQCDTTNITFSGKVVPVFAQNCLICHGNAVAPPDGGGLRLENYADVKMNITRAFGAMSHAPGFFPMPLGQSATIDTCEIKIVRIWKDAGMPDN